MKKIFLMTLVLGFRLSGILLLFVVVAKNVSIEDLGHFASCFSIASILGILIDFGFNQSILRDIPKNIFRAKKYINRGLSLKLAISCPIVVFFLLLYTFGIVEFIQVILIFYIVAGSFSEFYGVSLRSLGFYGVEAALQAAYTTILISLLYFCKFDVFETSLAMLILKSTQLYLIYLDLKGKIIVRNVDLSIKRLLLIVKKNYAYGIDVGVSNITSHIDVIIVSWTLGLSLVGIYQAGQKIAQGLCSLALIFSNVYLPLLSAHPISHEAFRKASQKVIFMMLTTGVCSSLILFFGSTSIINILYGEKLLELRSILPIFGWLVLARFISGTAGLYLTALGGQKKRTVYNLAGLGVLLALSPIMIHMYGVAGMIYSQVFSSVCVGVMYLLSFHGLIKNSN